MSSFVRNWLDKHRLQPTSHQRGDAEVMADPSDRPIEVSRKNVRNKCWLAANCAFTSAES